MSLQRIAKEIVESVEADLQRVGLLYRIFFRCKDSFSVDSKMGLKNYDGQKTFLRDAIGIRVNLYFADDLDILYRYIRIRFSKYFVEVTMDQNSTTEFKPTRINIVFNLTEQQTKEFRDLVKDNRIDSTFEIQLRTVLSEGWHEVDHDMRYKCKTDWEGHEDLSRYFNGILASLETSDFSILNLFDQLAYRHYRAGNWKGMLRSKFRLRIQDKNANEALEALVHKNTDLQKQLFKLDRADFVNRLLKQGFNFPITFTNVVLILNHLFLNREDLKEFQPGDFSIFLKPEQQVT
jgi:putative GTP pyrophosphokinase